MHNNSPVLCTQYVIYLWCET